MEDMKLASNPSSTTPFLSETSSERQQQERLQDPLQPNTSSTSLHKSKEKAQANVMKEKLSRERFPGKQEKLESKKIEKALNKISKEAQAQIHWVSSAEKEFVSSLRREVDGQALALSMEKLEAEFEREKANKLLGQAEIERAVISELRSEVEVEKSALTLAR